MAEPASISMTSRTWVKRAAGGAVDLRHAAEAVGVLDAGVVVAVRFAYLAVFEEDAQVCGGGDLSAMRPGGVDALVEGDGRTAQGFERHGSGEVEELGDAEGAVERERAGCGHGLGAVEEG